MRPLLIAALLAAAALPAAAQTYPPASPSSQGQPGSMTDMPRANGGGYGGMHAPPTPEIRAARQAVRQQCQADMARFCANVVPAPPQSTAAAVADDTSPGGAHPGRGAMMQCLRQHRADVTPACSQALDAMRTARMNARASQAPAAVPQP